MEIISTTFPEEDVRNLQAQLDQSQRAVQLWRTRYYDQSAENHVMKQNYFHEHLHTSLIPASGPIDDLEYVQVNLGRELITVREELVVTSNRLKLTESELDTTRVELVQSHTNVLILENELSVAQQKVKLQDE